MKKKRKERVAFENRETMREHNIQYIAHLSYYTNANGLLLVFYSKLGSAKSLSGSSSRRHLKSSRSARVVRRDCHGRERPRKCKLKRPPDFHSESAAKHVLFWVETDLQPIANHHPNFLDHSQFMSWPEHELHPRLLYDKGHSIRKTREELGFESK